jgi:hypothetical protein
MPKDEFDFEDPFELTGVALMTEEDTSEAMCECFIEEFLRMGYNHKQLLALFKNPHYIGMNMVLRNRGEQYVRDQIADVFARWGREVVWATPVGVSEGSVIKMETPPELDSVPIGFRPRATPAGGAVAGRCGCGSAEPCSQELEHEAGVTDPMGNAVPKLKF